MNYHEADARETSLKEHLGDPRPTVPVGESVTLIVLALALGTFLMWIVRVDWVLEFVAGLILIADCFIGVALGWLIYRLLDKAVWSTRAFAEWTKLTIAVIIGFSVAMTLMELEHSHKLVRAYDHRSSDWNGD